MRYPVRMFKDPATGLQELARFIRDGRQIENGRPIRNFGNMLPREVVANWLLCAVLNATNETAGAYFCTDPTGGDGLIVDGDGGDAQLTEHVIVTRPRQGIEVDAETLMLERIAFKNARGAQYAAGKVLVVFVNACVGTWHPDQVVRALPKPLHFIQVWAVALQAAGAGGYEYAVALLSLANGDAPVWTVKLASDFSGWSVWRVA